MVMEPGSVLGRLGTECGGFRKDMCPWAFPYLLCHGRQRALPLHGPLTSNVWMPPTSPASAPTSVMTILWKTISLWSLPSNSIWLISCKYPYFYWMHPLLSSSPQAITSPLCHLPSCTIFPPSFTKISNRSSLVSPYNYFKDFYSLAICIIVFPIGCPSLVIPSLVPPPV